MIKICIAITLLIVATATTYGQRVKQPPDVVEAYQVANEFQRLFAENLDFDRAYEATFTKDPARRRAVAIAESEVGSVAVDAADDATLISIYKNQMQIFFLLFALVGAADKDQNELVFQPEIRAIFDRKRPTALEQLPSYAAQLKRDAEQLRAHLNQLTTTYAFVADRVRQYKEEVFLKKIELPTDQIVKPLTAYSRGKVLRVDEEYYQIHDYVVIRENGKMRIVGLRLFYRMF